MIFDNELSKLLTAEPVQDPLFFVRILLKTPSNPTVLLLLDFPQNINLSRIYF